MKITVTLENLTTEELADVSARLQGVDSDVRPTQSPAVKLQKFGRIERADTPETLSVAPAGNGELVSDPIVYSESETIDSAEDVAGDVDAEGLPWDERIHSSSKKKTAKGVWARRRGIQDAEYNSVKAELLGAATTSAPQPAAVAPVPAPQPVQANTNAEAFAMFGGNPTPAPVPNAQPPVAAPVAVTSPAPAAPVPQPAATDFNYLLQRVQAGVAGGKITAQTLPQIVQQINAQTGLQATNITGFANQPGALEIAHNILNDMGV